MHKIVCTHQLDSIGKGVNRELASSATREKHQRLAECRSRVRVREINGYSSQG